MDRWRGIGLGLLCAGIWGMQSVISRQAIADNLTAADVTCLRFLVTGLLVLPIALRSKPAIVGRLGWPRALVLTLLAGAPYSLVLVGGLTFAPALHHAVITPGLIPMFSMVLAYVAFGERSTAAKWSGIALIVIGTATFSWQALANAPMREGAWRGDVMFILAAVMWAVFGLLSRHWNADPVETTVSIGVLSLLSVPVWALIMPMQLADASLRAIVLQASYQGAIVGVIALFLYARVVILIGPVRAALFLPVVPCVAAIGAWLVLGERPSEWELLGMLIVVTGMVATLRPTS
jgi:drug/metabolite transporter (DMT)-like permease